MKPFISIRKTLVCFLLTLFVFSSSLFSAPEKVSPETLVCGLCFSSSPFNFGDGTEEGCCLQDQNNPNEICTVTLCLGQTLYLQPANLTNPDTSVQIFWDFGGAATNPGPVNYPSPGVLTPTNTGTFTIGYTVAYPVGPPITCTIAFQVIVVSPPTPSFTISPNPACVGDNICLNITSPSGSYNSFSFTNLQGVSLPCTTSGSCDGCMSFDQPGTYDIQLTLTNGCSQSLIQQVVVNPFVPNFTWQSNCSNTVTFNNTSQCANQNLTYDWTVNGVPITSNYPSFSYTFPGPGTYTVTMDGSYQGNPVGSITQTVTISSGPTLQTFSSNPSCVHACNGVASVVPSGGTAPYTYSWSSGQTSPSILACAGVYTCTVTDASGCQVIATVTIHDPPALVATTNQTDPCSHSCNGSASVTVSGGTPPYTYLWSNGQTTVSAINLCQGNYTCTITDANGCTITQTVHLIPQSVLNSNILASATGPFCSNDPPFIIHGVPLFDGALTGVFSSPTGSAFTNGFFNAFSFNPATASAGTQTFNFTVSDNDGCPSTSTLSFVVNPAPKILFSSFKNVCIANGTIDLNNYVAPVGGTFSGVPGITGGHFLNLLTAGAGTFTLTYTYTGTNGCTSTATTPFTISTGDWQQTSSATTAGDIGRDIITDPATGDIYVTGDIVGPTTFGSGINTITIPGSGMFVAKYDECGVLQWVAYTLNGHANGRGITYDQLNHVVYVTGEISSGSSIETFVDAMVNPNITVPCTNPSINIPLSKSSYIAKYDAFDGCLINATGYGNQTTNILSAQSIDEEGGDVYVTGSTFNSGTNTREVIVSRVNSALVPVWTSVSTGGTSNAIRFGRDIAVQGNNVYITGTYQTKVSLGGLLLNTTGQSDAFVYKLNGLTGATLSGQTGGSHTGENCDGESITLSSVGIPYVTGDYSGMLSPTFGTGVLPGIAGVKSAFVCQLLPASVTSTWRRSINSASAAGLGISIDAAGLYVVGDYIGPTITFTTGPAVPANTGIWGKIFVAQLNPSNGVTTWGNYSTDLTPGPVDLHRAGGISANNSGFVYTTGHYQGFMDLPPFLPGAEGHLTATGAGISPNVFIMRSRTTNGNFMREAAGDSTLENSGSVNGFSVMPNPNNGVFKIVLADNSFTENVNIAVFDILGNKIYSEENSKGPSFEIDLQTMSAGIYFVRLTKGTETYQQKIIIDK